MMQRGLLLLVLAIVIAVAYGVVPLVQVDASITSLCAMLGLLTALAITGAWKVVKK